MTTALGHPLVIAHRGYSGRFPENTLISFQRAIDAGCDVLELDIRLTRDEAFVVMHEKGEALVTGGETEVCELTVEQIQSVDVGSWFSPRFASAQVPTLDEVIHLCRDAPIQLCIELKDIQRGLDAPGYEDRIVNVFRHHDLFSKAVVNVCSSDFSRRLKLQNPGIRVCLDAPHLRWAKATTDTVVREAKNSAADLLEYHHHFLTRPILDALQANGMPVWAWTVNAEPDMSHLAGWGVDGILTDELERLHEVLARTL